MTRDEIIEWIARQKAIEPVVEHMPPARPEVIEAAEKSVGPLPEPLKDLLSVSNGLRCDRIRLFSAFDEERPKKTWDSIQRFNDPAVTDALGGSTELLARFLVFADVGNCFLLWDRSDGSIWYEEAGANEIALTTFGFFEVLAAAFADYHRS